jgi:hypothetical protein
LLWKNIVTLARKIKRAVVFLRVKFLRRGMSLRDHVAQPLKQRHGCFIAL